MRSFLRELCNKLLRSLYRIPLFGKIYIKIYIRRLKVRNLLNAFRGVSLQNKVLVFYVLLKDKVDKVSSVVDGFLSRLRSMWWYPKVALVWRCRFFLLFPMKCTRIRIKLLYFSLSRLCLTWWHDKVDFMRCFFFSTTMYAKIRLYFWWWMDEYPLWWIEYFSDLISRFIKDHVRMVKISLVYRKLKDWWEKFWRDFKGPKR